MTESTNEQRNEGMCRCMDGWIPWVIEVKGTTEYNNEWMNEWINEWTNERTNERTN